MLGLLQEARHQLTMRPSTIRIRRSARPAKPRSWVTMDYRPSRFVHEMSKDAEHLFTRSRVEVSCWLVGQNDKRLVGQRSRDRNTLAFPTGKLARQFICMFFKPKRCEQIERTLAHASVIEASPALSSAA